MDPAGETARSSERMVKHTSCSLQKGRLKMARKTLFLNCAVANGGFNFSLPWSDGRAQMPRLQRHRWDGSCAWAVR